MRMFPLLVTVITVVMNVTGCAEHSQKTLTQWDAYYARADKPRAHVVVMPPEGSTVPMSKLIAEYVVEHLAKHKISSKVGHRNQQVSTDRHFVLNGVIENNHTASQKKIPHIIRWSLFDSQGRLISSHAEGVASTAFEWDFGSARLLNAIGISTAGPIAEMVLAETRATLPLDPMQWGVMVDPVAGLSAQNSQLLTKEIRNALRRKDMQVTGDPRQANFRLAGDVSSQIQADGLDHIRIVWKVLTMGGTELGRAVQENKLKPGVIQNSWAGFASDVAKAAAIGVQYVFGTRSGPLPRERDKTQKGPPKIVLPGVPGRAPAPPH